MVCSSIVHILTAHIMAHSIYREFFLRHFFAFFLVVFFFFCCFSRFGLFMLSVANSHNSRFLLSGFVYSDDAYSYGDNFIYLYSHYDLSMWRHNKGFNEFDSLAHCHMRCIIFVEECWWISRPTSDFVMEFISIFVRLLNNPYSWAC